MFVTEGRMHYSSRITRDDNRIRTDVRVDVYGRTAQDEHEIRKDIPEVIRAVEKAKKKYFSDIPYYYR